MIRSHVLQQRAPYELIKYCFPVEIEGKVYPRRGIAPSALHERNKTLVSSRFVMCSKGNVMVEMCELTADVAPALRDRVPKRKKPRCRSIVRFVGRAFPIAMVEEVFGEQLISHLESALRASVFDLVGWDRWTKLHSRDR
jgi:hypothetical protein